VRVQEGDGGGGDAAAGGPEHRAGADQRPQAPCPSRCQQEHQGGGLTHFCFLGLYRLLLYLKKVFFQLCYYCRSLFLISNLIDLLMSLAVLRIRDVYPGPEFFSSRIQDQKDSRIRIRIRIKEFSILTQKIVSEI
jgi:hypothetical protein